MQSDERLAEYGACEYWVPAVRLGRGRCRLGRSRRPCRHRRRGSCTTYIRTSRCHHPEHKNSHRDGGSGKYQKDNVGRGADS